MTTAPRRGLLLFWAAALFAVDPANANDPMIRLPPGFRLEVMAEGLGGPRFMTVDPAGNLLVSIPSEGRVVGIRTRGALQRKEGVTTVASSLNLPHGLVFHRGDLYVAETGRIVRFRYDAATLQARDGVVVVSGLPPGGHHWTRAIAVGSDGALYVAVGSSCDVCREQDHRRAAIVRYRIDGSHERLFATGLRNPVGLAVHPGTGALWTTVNERDWRSGGAPPDYVTEVRDGASYGWPHCFASNGTFAVDPELPGARPCRDMTRPTLELPPHSAPLGLAFYTGRAFPPPYRGSLFVACHGARPGLPPAGYSILRVAFEHGRPTGVDVFAAGWRDGDRVHGRPVDLAVGHDGALYVSDDHSGRIHRISYGR